jgi:CubicO group peptidase (beta-lactamase class C family)
MRKLGGNDAITVADRFATGSCTKRLTLYLVARLVDEGKVSLDLTLGEGLPDVPMRDDYKPVTLAQLLAHTGGIAGYERIGPKMTPELFDTEGTPEERQARFTKHLLGLPPAGAIGKDAIYSNAGYMLVAAMVSRKVGRSYEDLVDAYVFKPLALDRAGWGRPSSAAHPAEPWLHMAGPDGYRPEPEIDRPPDYLFRAAGSAHMSVGDLARFANEDLAVRKGASRLLPAKAASAWIAMDAPGLAGKPRIVYAGGAPWMAACYAIWPEKGLVAAIAVNGGTPGDSACKRFVQAIEERYASQATKT